MKKLVLAILFVVGSYECSSSKQSFDKSRDVGGAVEARCNERSYRVSAICFALGVANLACCSLVVSEAEKSSIHAVGPCNRLEAYVNYKRSLMSSDDAQAYAEAYEQAYSLSTTKKDICTFNVTAIQNDKKNCKKMLRSFDVWIPIILVSGVLGYTLLGAGLYLCCCS